MGGGVQHTRGSGAAMASSKEAYAFRKSLRKVVKDAIGLSGYGKLSVYCQRWCNQVVRLLVHRLTAEDRERLCKGEAMQDLTTDQIREHWRADAAAIAQDPGEADKRYIMSRASDLYFQENRAALKEPKGNPFC